MSFEVQMCETMTVMEVDVAVVENEADILARYTLAIPLFNFLLATLPRDDGPSILSTALTALYQIAHADFLFVHLNDMLSVLRLWPDDVSASLIMNLLYRFGSNNCYRNVALFTFVGEFVVIRHDRPRHDVKFIGTIAFKHDSKFTGYIVSSGDTALGSVALVCGIGLYRSLEVA
ncbi:hypothetical protein HETIRDRAFT_101044 [Heterobasidion irregulare TC 32-1]|uniref:Uncharacterized protein n=1 Tax=Heterobasidion irregulare (strain TC 32-1) TaxID=747525 RepID=W4KJJ5_HETIT|nr:uncharacterized protein HETIRDRAFT_101044 [Heterobasidion irregulare TC 32-1]ETW85236.1 hypothetical protein HETIRDRAFT_101044 [Heterobasidion irregulare TC 32-1]